MKLRKNIFTLILFVLYFSSAACAGNQSIDQSFRAASGQFSFNHGQHEINIPLDITVNGWSVNCSRTRAVVWGQAEDLAKIGDPPVVRVYVIDISHAKIINNYTVTRGPYEVTFSKDQKQASVDDYVIDQNSGEVVSMTEDMKLEAESCPLFPGKQSN